MTESTGRIMVSGGRGNDFDHHARVSQLDRKCGAFAAPVTAGGRLPGVTVIECFGLLGTLWPAGVRCKVRGSSLPPADPEAAPAIEGGGGTSPSRERVTPAAEGAGDTGQRKSRRHRPTKKRATPANEEAGNAGQRKAGNAGQRKRERHRPTTGSSESRSPESPAVDIEPKMSDPDVSLTPAHRGGEGIWGAADLDDESSVRASDTGQRKSEQRRANEEASNADPRRSERHRPTKKRARPTLEEASNADPRKSEQRRPSKERATPAAERASNTPANEGGGDAAQRASGVSGPFSWFRVCRACSVRCSGDKSAYHLR